MGSYDDAWNKAWVAVGPVEGGYSNNPADPGGETMWGVTQRLARAHGYTGLMKDLQREDAKAICFEEFWIPLSLDSVASVDWHVSAELFDIAMNMGRYKAAHWLQAPLKALHDATLPTDGVLGPATVKALVDFVAHRGADGRGVLLKCLAALRCVDYLDQVDATPSKREFVFGWIRLRVLQDGPQGPG